MSGLTPELEANDVFVPPLLLPFLPDGGWLDSPTYYVSLKDSTGIERALSAYVIGPNGHGYRIKQSVRWGVGDPADPDTERIPDTLESVVHDFGPLDASALREALAADYPGLCRG